MDVFAALPLWFNRSISMSPRFCGIGAGSSSSTSTRTLRASPHVGIGGKASGFAGLREESKVANCARSGTGAGLNVGIGFARYCWFIGLASIGGATGGGAPYGAAP